MVSPLLRTDRGLGILLVIAGYVSHRRNRPYGRYLLGAGVVLVLVLVGLGLGYFVSASG